MVWSDSPLSERAKPDEDIASAEVEVPRTNLVWILAAILNVIGPVGALTAGAIG